MTRRAERELLRSAGVSLSDAELSAVVVDRPVSMLVPPSVPPLCEVRNDENGNPWLVWCYAPPDHAARSYTIARRSKAANALTAFQALHNKTDDAIVRFASQFGVLDFCACGEPIRSPLHAWLAGPSPPAPVVRSWINEDPRDRWERLRRNCVPPPGVIRPDEHHQPSADVTTWVQCTPLEAWRSRVRESRVLLLATAHLRSAQRGRRAHDDKIPFDGDQVAFNDVLLIAGGGERRGADPHGLLLQWGALVDVVNQRWLDVADVRLRCGFRVPDYGHDNRSWSRLTNGEREELVRRASLEGRIVRDVDVRGLFGLLAQQLGEVLAREEGRVACAYCLTYFIPDRAPAAGRRPCCGESPCRLAQQRGWTQRSRVKLNVARKSNAPQG